MIGRLFCKLWAHHWDYSRDNNRGVMCLYCTRCAKVKVNP